MDRNKIMSNTNTVAPMRTKGNGLVSVSYVVSHIILISQNIILISSNIILTQPMPNFMIPINNVKGLMKSSSFCDMMYYSPFSSFFTAVCYISQKINSFFTLCHFVILAVFYIMPGGFCRFNQAISRYNKPLILSPQPTKVY